VLKHLQSRRGDRTVWERGFTLVELLVVIVILGILAAVVVFAVGGTEEDAKVKACLTERSSVEAAVEAFRSQFPDDGQPDTGALETKGFLKHPPKYWTVSGGDLQRGGTGNADTAKCNTNVSG
jgi:prepilin-type N-terminal cleavage/methylation domain-containing protein